MAMCILPNYVFGYSARYNSLVAEKQRKMEELEKCTGNINGWKIAGISTLGLTAVGVAGNIALADERDRIKKNILDTEKAIKNKQEEQDKCVKAGGKWTNDKCECGEKQEFKDDKCTDKAESSKQENKNVNKTSIEKKPSNATGTKITYSAQNTEFDLGISGFAECSLSAKCVCSKEDVTTSMGDEANAEYSNQYNYVDECNENCMNFCKEKASEAIEKKAAELRKHSETSSTTYLTMPAVTGFGTVSNSFGQPNNKAFDTSIPVKKESEDSKQQTEQGNTSKQSDDWQKNAEKTIRETRINFQQNWSIN